MPSAMPAAADIGHAHQLRDHAHQFAAATAADHPHDVAAAVAADADAVTFGHISAAVTAWDHAAETTEAGGKSAAAPAQASPAPFHPVAPSPPHGPHHHGAAAHSPF